MRSDFFLIRYHEFHRTFADDLMAGLSPAQVRGVRSRA